MGDVARGGVAKDDFAGATVGSSVEPDVGVDAESFRRVGGDVDRVSDVLEQREEALDAHSCERSESKEASGRARARARASEQVGERREPASSALRRKSRGCQMLAVVMRGWRRKEKLMVRRGVNALT